MRATFKPSFASFPVPGAIQRLFVTSPVPLLDRLMTKLSTCILDSGIEIVGLATLAPHTDQFKTLTHWSSRLPSPNSDCGDVANHAQLETLVPLPWSPRTCPMSLMRSLSSNGWKMGLTAIGAGSAHHISCPPLGCSLQGERCRSHPRHTPPRITTVVCCLSMPKLLHDRGVDSGKRRKTTAAVLTTQKISVVHHTKSQAITTPTTQHKILFFQNHPCWVVQLRRRRHSSEGGTGQICLCITHVHGAAPVICSMGREVPFG